VHFFENLKIDRVPKETREKDILLNKECLSREKALPSNRKMGLRNSRSLDEGIELSRC